LHTHTHTHTQHPYFLHTLITISWGCRQTPTPQHRGLQNTSTTTNTLLQHDDINLFSTPPHHHLVGVVVVQTHPEEHFRSRNTHHLPPLRAIDLFSTRHPPLQTTTSAAESALFIYFPARGFHGTPTLMQKRKLFPDLPTASPGPFGLPRRTLS
jgi:hypothetical protein